MKMEIIAMYMVAIVVLGGLFLLIRWHYRRQTEVKGPGPDKRGDEA